MQSGIPQRVNRMKAKHQQEKQHRKAVRSQRKGELPSGFRPGSMSSVRPERQASRLSAARLVLSTIDNTHVRSGLLVSSSIS
ncbi:hypothetical protein ACH5RR_039303 [Cinchona calisaya]|uniref:Uncharacterized protein n=1 Tax=Cinchona calisaya TaxID=153742 RepID=A0ABD2Y0P3_9GENT